MLRRVAVASQRRLKSTAASQRSTADLLQDFDALQSKRGKASKRKKGAATAPDVSSPEPVEPVAKSTKPEIKYKTNLAGKSMELMAFIAARPLDSLGQGEVEAADDVPGIEVGRVVELRR